jgi:hypothetical protein
MDFIHFASDPIVGFIGERCGDDPFHSRSTASISKQSRINAVAGDDTERVWNFHEAKLTMERPSTQAPPRFNRGGDA